MYIHTHIILVQTAVGVYVHVYTCIYYTGADCSGRVCIYMYILYWCRLQWACMYIHACIYYTGADCSGCRLQWACMDIHVYIILVQTAVGVYGYTCIYYTGADCSGCVCIYMYILYWCRLQWACMYIHACIYYTGADCSGRVWIYMYILYWCRLQWACMDIHVYIILVQTAVGVYVYTCIYYTGADCSGRVCIYMYILYWCRLQWVQTAVGVDCSGCVCIYMYIHVRESDCLGCAVLLCLVVCLTLLASFFLPSHLSLNMYIIYWCRLQWTCMHVHQVAWGGCGLKPGVGVA